jgi:hypothetical protein
LLRNILNQFWEFKLVKHFIFLILLSQLPNCNNEVRYTGPSYIKTHPDCIIGTYYNYYTNNCTSSVTLRADSVYVHRFQFGNVDETDSNKWKYTNAEGNDSLEGIVIVLYHWKHHIEEGRMSLGVPSDSGGANWYIYLINCNELYFSVYKRTNFFKK